MKNISQLILKALLLCAASQSIAAIESDVVYPYNTTETLTTKISGVENYNSTSVTYDNLWLYNADLTLASTGKNITIGTANTKSLSVGAGGYVVAVEGNSSLTIKNGAKFIIYSSASLGIINGADTFDLTVESNGVFRAHKLFSNAKKTTLNLMTETAISQDKMTVGAAGGQKEIVVNMNCNQKFALDSRDNTIYSFNITNDACLTVTGVSLLNADSGNVTIKIADGLVNGSLLFLTDASYYTNEYSWNGETSELSITADSTKSQIASFVDADGNALKNLTWTAVEGGYTLSASAVPEPAHWAAIIGAIAMSLAIYRRRK
jgi:hypothetical protein